MKKYIGLVLSIITAPSLVWGMQLSKQSTQKKRKDKDQNVGEFIQNGPSVFDLQRIRSVSMNNNGSFIAVCLQDLCSCNRILKVISTTSDRSTFKTPLIRFSGDNDPTSFPDKAHIFLSDDGRRVGMSHYDKAYVYDTLLNRKIFELKLYDGSYTHATQNKNMLALAVEDLIFMPEGISSAVEIISYKDENLPDIVNVSYKLPYKSLHLVDMKNCIMRSIDLKKRLAIRSLCFDPSGSFLAVAADKRAEIYKTDTLERVLCIIPYKSHVNSVSFNHDGTLFGVASEKKIRVFTLDGKLVTCIYDKEKKPGSPDNPYPNISFIGKNSLIALRTCNDVHFFNLKGKCIFSLSKHTNIPLDFKTITCFNKKKQNMLIATDAVLKMIKFSDFAAM